MPFIRMPLANKRYYIRTYGCQMNALDSLQAGALLERMGMCATETPENADVILVNTCSVREKPVHKLLSDLGRLREVKAANPELVLGVMGCVAQQEKEALFKKCRDLDLVIGPDHLPQLPELVEKLWRERKPLSRTQFTRRSDYKFIDLVPSAPKTNKQAFVTIMKGCDNMCSFCIVPYVRGREVSRPSSDILAEVDELLACGVEEITLLGQNVNSYGLKTPGELTFTQLLYAIGKQLAGKPAACLRFTTSHPKDVGPDLINAFAELPMLAPHFHLPVQSGSNRILERMRRSYTRESFVHTAQALRRARPDIALTTDIIVGFPGESAQDFNDTLSLMEELRFDGSFSFLYSPRPYTAAARLPDLGPVGEKKERLARLQALQQTHSRSQNRSWIGNTVPVLIESVSTGTQKFQGRSAHNKVVHFGSETPYDVGARANVQIERVSAAALYGVAH